MVKAGTDVNVSCPGISELSLISSLEWRCQGCNLPAAAAAASNASGASSRNSNSVDAVKLVDYTNNAVVIWNNKERLSLDTQTYGLQFNPVRNWDDGEYFCLANDRRRPDAIIHLVVQGRVRDYQLLYIQYIHYYGIYGTYLTPEYVT